MREVLRDPERLKLIKRSIDNVREFTDSLTYEEFLADKKGRYAVMMNIHIIGDSANMLTKEFRDNHPELPWNGIIRMRNVIAHGYYQVNMEIIWETVQNEIPLLDDKISGFLRELDL